MSKYTFDPTDYNPTNTPTFSELLETTLTRRSFITGTMSSLASTALLGGCATPHAIQDSSSLGFESVKGTHNDKITLPEGYKAQIIAPWGTPLFSKASALANTRTFSTLDQSLSTGQNHDGLHYFPLNGSNNDGLLCVNHEYTNPSIHGGDTNKQAGKRSSPDQVRKEIQAHGISIFRIKKVDGVWQHLPDDPHNQRVTASSKIKLSGAIAGNLTTTRFSKDGMHTRGTINNCGSGVTPWGTYLSCEENWPNYFVSSSPTASQKRLGIGNDAPTYFEWEHLAGHADEVNHEFSRFDSSASEENASLDYRNESNGFGYIVEVDPYTPNALPVKRTSMGRFRHECCHLGKIEAGKPLTFYSGHDGRFEYIYKFVSDENWNPADASPKGSRLDIGSKYMDKGTLYVAIFNGDNSGKWIPLKRDTLASDGSPLSKHFDTIEEILLCAPMAADLVSATPMDRPEWTSVNPLTGDIYFTLTNNTKRNSTNAANPRLKNEYGHIVRWKESPEDVTTFNWEVFLFGGAQGTADNPSGLTIDNEFASPDGLLFDPRGVLWIQTDNGKNAVGENTNNQMLAVVPTKTQGPITKQNQALVKRFLVGPKGCEITGISFTPDLKTLFVNIQHPDNWPASSLKAEDIPAPEDNSPPRSATIAITKHDGGEIGS